MASPNNFVAKHMNTVNRASTHRDRKNDYVRQNPSLNDYLDEWPEFNEDEDPFERELFIEDSTESSLKRS